MRTTVIALAVVFNLLIIETSPSMAAEKLVAGYSSISPAEWTLVTAA